MNRFVALSLLPVVIAAAGCSSSSTTAPGPTPTPSTSSPSPSASSTPEVTPSASEPPTTSPSANPATTAVAPGRCHTADLAIEKGEGQGAAGSLYLTVVLANRSAQPCRILGFPGLGLLDGAGKTLPSNVIRGEGTPVPVLLAAGAKANFTFKYTENPSGSDTQAACPAASRLIVTPPDETTTLTVAFAGSPCRGKLTVSAIVEGSEGSTP